MYLKVSRNLFWRVEPPSAWPLWLHVVFISLIAVSHDLTRVTNPQFWAEDGAVWYRQAYELGAASLVLEQSGYYQTLPRLIALLATLLPLAWGPTVFLCAAFYFQLLPSLLLLSARLDDAGLSRSARVVLAYFCVAVPNAWEVHLNLTNSQWFLAISAFLLIFASQPRNVLEHIFDIAVLVLCGLSGPFAILLAPIATWRWIGKRTRFRLLRALSLLFGASAQAFSVLASAGASRSEAPLGASFTGLVEIISGQIVLAGTVGRKAALSIVAAAGEWYPVFSMLLFAAAGVMVVLAWKLEKSGLLRMFLLFAAGVLAAALVSPQVSLDVPQWRVLAVPGSGGRYFLIPVLAWFACVLVLAFRGAGLVRLAGLAGSMLFAVGIASDWQHSPLPDKGFRAKASAFDKLPTGQVRIFEIAPDGWSMTLKKE